MMALPQSTPARREHAFEGPLVVGIVGHEAAKFTSETEAAAREEIRRLIAGAARVVSGRCHLGGIDIWAIQEAKRLGIPTTEYPPARLTWEGGYKQRNQQIAEASDVVASIVVERLPATYAGMRFPQGCYHCKTAPEHHVKSGGCWTMKYATKIGKSSRLVVIREGV